MSIPGNTLSTEPVIGDFLAPDDNVRQLLVDWELGGIALSDPSEGLQVQEWKLFLEGADIVVEAQTTLQKETVITAAGVPEEIALSFDQNMQPTVVWKIGDDIFHYWYDSSIADYTTTQYTGIVNPRLTHDDKRKIPLDVGVSDVLLVYFNGNDLCYRQQRDRYDTEYTLGTFENAGLGRVGFTNLSRVQFELRQYGEDSVWYDLNGNQIPIG